LQTADAPLDIGQPRLGDDASWFGLSCKASKVQIASALTPSSRAWRMNASRRRSAASKWRRLVRGGAGSSPICS
jgi:hypothetical protein